MKMQIDWVEEVQTSTGKNYKRVNVAGLSGDISCWPDYSQYNDVAPGAEVEGVIRTSGKYKNLVDATPTNKTYQPRTGPIREAQERKGAMIAQAQENKGEGVRMASAGRDATQIVITFYPEYADKNNKEILIKQSWEDWRKWFYDKYDEPFV